jgi:hypothetical protein
MPAKPRWLLAIPDAIQQLEALDRELLTRRDLEQLFGVSKTRAAALIRTFGAGRTANVRTLRKTQLLRQLRARQNGAASSGEVDRRPRLLATLRQARITRIRVPVSVDVRALRLAGLPAGVTVEPGRIEVRFRGARDAVARLFALAQALTNDYDRFKDLVGRGGESQ